MAIPMYRDDRTQRLGPLPAPGRAEIARQYVGYIDKLAAGQTARLTAYPVTY